jgi:hypothetical protein
MSVRAVLRYVEHSIGLDPHAERDAEGLECTDCPWVASGAGVDRSFEELLDRAIKHTGATGHTGFRQTTTNLWRVVRTDKDLVKQLSVPVGNPLRPQNSWDGSAFGTCQPARSSPGCPEAPPMGSPLGETAVTSPPPRPPTARVPRFNSLAR